MTNTMRHTEHEKHDTMSASEQEQASPVHSERRMLITSYACDTMSASGQEQARPVHSERRMLITGFACDITVAYGSRKEEI